MKSRQAGGAFGVVIFAWLQSICAQDERSNAELIEFARNRNEQVRITADPVWISARFATLCKKPAPDLLKKLAANPHWQTAIHVYSNPEAVASMWDPFEKFPVGTILLKEKFSPNALDKPEFFTGMVKRITGYAPDNGDWEYFTIDGGLSQITSRGKLDSCVACHRDYAASDFVSKQYAALATVDRKVWINGNWRETDGAIAAGSDGEFFLPASLAETNGPKLSRREAIEVWRQKAERNEPALIENPPEDLSEFGGPSLRYEPSEQKNTLGYWTQIDDWASWKIDIRRSGTYRVNVLQGCGPGSGGAEVAVSFDGQQLSFIVEETKHFQDFKWRDIGEIKIASPQVGALTVKPQSKPGPAVMDLRQVRVRLIHNTVD